MNKKLVILMILVPVVAYVAFVETNNHFNSSIHDRPMNMQDLEGFTGITCSSSIFGEKKCTGTTVNGEIIDLPVESVDGWLICDGSPSDKENNCQAFNAKGEKIEN